MANGTYGDTEINPLIGYTDGLHKNYDNRNWVFYDPRSRIGFPALLFYIDMNNFAFESEPTINIATGDGSNSTSIALPSGDSYLLPGFTPWFQIFGGLNASAENDYLVSADENGNVFQYETLHLLVTEDQFVLPVSRGTGIYCFWRKVERRLWQRTDFQISNPFNFSIEEVYSQLPGYEVSACFLINENSIRDLSTIPETLLSILRSRNSFPTYIEQPQFEGPVIGGDGVNYAVGNDPLSLNSISNSGFGAKIYEALGLSAPSSLPAVSLQGFVSDDETYFELKTTGDNPINDYSVFAANPAARIPWPTPGESFGVIAAWDWGQSEYCRARLLELGFLPQDLVFALPPAP
jgi:hypothetical protein